MLGVTNLVRISLLTFGYHVCCNVINNAHHSTGVLVLTHTLCRHGDRNPQSFYPKDPYSNLSLWPRGVAELTNTGMQQHYILGRYLRQRYSSVIPDGEYSPSTVYVESTDTDRTVASALSNLAGMYPPVDNQVWNGALMWQPVPVHTIPSNDDFTLQDTRKCPRFDYVQALYLNENDRFKKLIARYQPLINFLKENTGESQLAMSDLLVVHDTLSIEKLKGFDLSNWAEEVMIPNGDFDQLINYWFPINAATTEMQMYKAGYLLQEIFTRCLNKSESKLTPDRTVWMYFAHDFIMIYVMKALGIYSYQQPPYASCIFFELYQREDDSFYVQIFYKHSTDTNIPPTKLPNCDLECPLSDLFNIYEDILPSQSYDDACLMRPGETMPPGGNPAKWKL